jgi:aspartate-semialdehyde dehydrogenase
MVVALAPLHRAARIRRVVVTTFQSVSGAGSAAVAELDRQVREVPAGMPARPEHQPHPIFGNVIPQVSTLRDAYPGYYGEEIKMIRETRKIFSEPDLALTATCVRVPVFLAHSEAINVEFEEKLSAARAREILSASPGIVVVDDPARSRYPMPIDAAGKDEVFVGRIREDPSLPNTLDLWCVSDNIRKGAATNAIQIAEKMIEMGLI